MSLFNPPPPIYFQYRGFDQLHMNFIHDLEDLETIILGDFSKFG